MYFNTIPACYHIIIVKYFMDIKVYNFNLSSENAVDGNRYGCGFKS